MNYILEYKVFLNKFVLQQEDWKDFLIDGLHLSNRGSELLANMLIPVLNEKVSSNLKDIFPDWKDMNENCQITIKQWVNDNIDMFK